MAINTITGEEGGYQLAPEYIAEVHKLVARYSVVRSVFKNHKTDTKSGYLADLVNTVTIYSPDEGASPTASAPTWGQTPYLLKRMAGLVEANEDWEEDAFANPQAEITESIFEAMGKAEDTHLMLGDGTSNSLGFTGLINFSTQTLNKEMGQLTYDDVTLCEAMISEKNGDLTAVIASPRGVRQLKLITDPSGRYLFDNISISQSDSDRPMTLKGYLNGNVPVYMSKALVSYETAENKGVMFFVDGNNGAVFVHRYNEVKFKKEALQKMWRYAYSAYTRLDFVPLFPETIVKIYNLAL